MHIMNTICAYIPDNLAAGFPEKLKLLRELKLCSLEVRQEELPLESLPMAEVLCIRNLLYDEGCAIGLYQTKIKGLKKAAVQQILQSAHLLETEHILYDPEGCTDEEIAFFFKAAASFDIPVMVENKASSILSDAAAIEAFLKKHPCGVAFNPLEFVKLKQHPFFHVYYNSRLKNNISLLRLNDGIYLDGSATPLAQGNGEIKELISIMKARSFSGMFSLSPYLPGSTAEDLANMAAWLRSTLKGL